MAIQQCLVLIKPDGLIKSLTGNIISALSEAKLKIVGAKIIKVSQELAEKHYSELKEKKIKQHGAEKGKEIFDNVIRYIQGHFHTDRVFALVYHGEDAIKKIKSLAGSTNPEEASPDSIRGKYGRINSKSGVLENVIHTSDSDESSKKEIQLWFKPEELTELIYPIKKAKVEGEVLLWDN